MSTLFVTLLSLHVALGLVGVIASFWTTFLLLKETFSTCAVRMSSATAFIAYGISWITGGWYYWKYYGSIVKPKIVGGDFAWAHLVFTESKEHVFLFLPFAALCIMLILWIIPNDLKSDATLRKHVVALATLTTVVATLITLSGVLISGGAR